MFHKGEDGKPKGFGFSGFALGKKPDEVDPAKPVSGMAGMPSNAGGRFMPGRSFGYSTNIGKRRARNEDEYFDDDDEEGDLEYQPAPGSPGADDKNKDGSDSDDPLDAFMADIEAEVKGKMKEGKEHKEKPKEKKKDKGVRDDIENEDVQEAFFRYMEENPMAGVILDEDETGIEYDADGNPIIPEKNKMIDPLPPIDHTEIDYKKFEKNFYQEHEEISKLTQSQVDELRNKLGLRVSGFAPPNPTSSFAHFGFDDELMAVIRKSEYTQPTPIQAQGVPIILNGRDIIGIAKTGSGKTATYLWPLLVHIMDQKELEPGDGPIGLILAPTRELSQQIYHEAKKFGKVYNINVVCAYGGGNMYEQTKACQEGAEIIVATPGRLIDLIKKKSTNLQRVTYLVYDEADRMFDMGFEPQVRSIANHVRKDRQSLLFSATFKKKVERLARDILLDPIRVVQGEAGEANEDVNTVYRSITSWTCQVDVARQKPLKICVLLFPARGLDIPYIRTVVNYDVARDIDTHTHRIGRTGRAGEKGYAYTLLTEKDKDFAGPLVRNMEVANQYVPKALMDLALQNPWFNKSRFKQGKGKKLNVGGKGLGFKERPGLGAESCNHRTQDSTSMASFRGVGTSSRSLRVIAWSAMKQAFSAQFRSNFVAAADNIVPQKTGHILEPLNATRNPPPQESSEEPSNKRKKRSRWD
ncbi:LOW QUALITY PROTEIN: ATP-dependent RNA helicase DDX42-like [Argopecten irradians]|uniref:LOW QUALITY PROTEIN: ATP-dependent RNA helicase DDX42-like n=1 Tax=Argopecten irradians TaxID=31199 RepID=UPI00371F8089